MVWVSLLIVLDFQVRLVGVIWRLETMMLASLLAQMLILAFIVRIATCDQLMIAKKSEFV